MRDREAKQGNEKKYNCGTEMLTREKTYIEIKKNHENKGRN